MMRYNCKQTLVVYQSGYLTGTYMTYNLDKCELLITTNICSLLHTEYKIIDHIVQQVYVSNA